MLDLPFRPDRARPEPVFRQLEAYLRGLVEAGRNLTPPRIADGLALFAAVMRRQLAPGRRRSSARGSVSERRATRRAPGEGGTVDAVGTRG